LESTLSGETYVRIFKRALSLSYELELHYLWLSNVAKRSLVCVAAFEWADTTFRGSFDYKQNAGCRSCESSSGIAVDVQQRLNCALP
jgi:hypothetical protein